MARVQFRFFLVLVSLLVCAAYAHAQSPSVSVAEVAAVGEVLVDGEGRTLYLTLEDGPDGAGCDDACARYWPAFTSDELPEAGAGVDPELLGLQEAGDGTAQVTYNGWPLYYFVHDRGPGAARGQASADIWYVVSPAGEPVGVPAEASGDAAAESGQEVETEEAPAAVSSEEASELAALMAEGEAVYARVCVACHGPGGEGGVGVRLIGNPRLDDARGIANAVTHGTAYMPALGGQMTAEETAAVLTFVRNSWGNEHGVVPLEVVEEVRE